MLIFCPWWEIGLEVQANILSYRTVELLNESNEDENTIFYPDWTRFIFWVKHSYILYMKPNVEFDINHISYLAETN